MTSSTRYSVFAEYVAQADQEMDLARGALLIATDEYPDLDIAAYTKRMDMLATGVAKRLRDQTSPPEQLKVIADYLFHQRRFRGNEENYYDPRNSYLNDVLDRRLGIPISLSVIYIDIGRRLGLPIRGVGLPGHFLVRYDEPGYDLFADPFHGGRLLTAEGCHDIVARMYGESFVFSGHYLSPVTVRAILIRMLGNLKRVYTHMGDLDRAIRVLDKILLLNPQATNEYRERALMHLASKRLRPALCDLISYLTNYPDCPDCKEIHQQIDLIITGMAESA